MTSRHPNRTLVALVVALAVILAACGTRLEHATIAAAGGGGTGIQGSDGTGLPGSDGETGLPGGDVGAGRIGPGGTGPDGTGAVGTGPGGNGPGGSGGSDGGGGANGTPIVVGTVETYSGAGASVTKSGALALKAWAATTNSRGGINGRPIKLITYDDGGDSAKQRSLIQRLVEQDKAVAVLGTDSQGGPSPIIKYVEEKRVPVLGSCYGTVFKSPMFFSPCNTLEDAVYHTALVGAKYGKGKKLGLFVCVESSDCTYAADRMFNKYAEKAGLDPVYRANISVAQPDFTAECIEARRRGVELLTVMADTNTVVRAAESCRRQNFNPQFLQGEQISRADFATTPGLTDVLVPSRIFPYDGLSTPAFKEFEAAWKKYAGGAARSGNAAKNWAGAKIFEAAARMAGKNISRESVLKALYSFSGKTFGGLTIPLTFKAGQGSRPASCGFAMRASSGKWVADPKPFCF